ncbi:hypothetical protein LTR96_003179 [Exophiala xenobiotica]|nr:hypothetical protein LTR72_001099 [Exophiala xenobiotica]KAK5271355.1 hypothetical protein LTR96_003179 [Exophiala xenobiotica]KAK5289520.1 hypothetical protein LTR14_007158 [Exophiala xenobiotica]
MHILRQVPWARHSRCRIGTRPIWVLLAFSTFYALALLCFQSISHRDPSSVFFDASRAYNPLYSAHRAEQAERYITSINQSGRHVVNNNEPPLLCLGIATVARRGTQYVRNTVGSFFAGLSEEERDSIFFDLFVAHSDPAKHPIFAEHWLDVLPDRILQYPKDTAEFDQVRAWEEGGWYRNKSIYDYRYLLRDCYDTGAPYVAMVEDDTLAVQGWFGRLLDALATVKVKMNGYPSDQRWLYLRLFYTDELLGWNSEQWTTYLFWSFVVWISLLTMMLATRRRFPTQLEFLTNEMIAAICLRLHPGDGPLVLPGREADNDAASVRSPRNEQVRMLLARVCLPPRYGSRCLG